MNEELLKQFFKLFPPNSDGVKPNEETLTFFEDKLPEEILAVWKQYGFASLGNGILKMVNPTDYFTSFYSWIGGDDHTKIPLFVTAFGDFFYIRIVGEGQQDICFLDIHRRVINVCAYSLEEFFNIYIMEQSSIDKDLKRELFTAAFSTNGALTFGDIYSFVHPVKKGGAEDAQNIVVDNGVQHQLALLQLS